MPRGKEFDETRALDAAVRVFWEKGYEAAAVGDIVAAAHASRYGLCDVFRDKRVCPCCCKPARAAPEWPECGLRTFIRAAASSACNTLNKDDTKKRQV